MPRNRLPAACTALGLRALGRHAIVGSVDVARRFGRQHGHVLRDIDELRRSPKLESVDWFTPTTYDRPRNPAQRAYDMTRDGFVLLVMGWTGPDALDFKIRYIAGFNAMEEALLRGAAEGGTNQVLLWVKERMREMWRERHADRATLEDGAERSFEQVEVDALADELMLRHPGKARRLVGKCIHDYLHHKARQEATGDPDQLSLFSVRRDGFERRVEVDELSEDEAKTVTRQLYQAREALRAGINKLMQRARRVLRAHPIGADELRALAPDLLAVPDPPEAREFLPWRPARKET